MAAGKQAAARPRTEGIDTPQPDIRQPTTELDARFSDPAASATDWLQARAQLAAADTYWLATVREDGRPHVTTIAAVWLDEVLCFTTGESEQKARNLAANPAVVILTGCAGFRGLDVVVEGEARPIEDEHRLRRVAAAYVEKYGDVWRYRIRDGHLALEEVDGIVLAFDVAPRKGFGFAKDDPFGQTRWRFPGA